jgi:hypothetical protein
MQLVALAARSVFNFYPPAFRAAIEPALPALLLDASQLAVEVMRAEQEGILFPDAARQVRFPLLGRVHFGLGDLLQRRLPVELRDGVRAAVRQAARGDLDGLRRAFFTAAVRRDDPQAALMRFLLYQAVRLNLLVATWDDPAVEVLGSLARIEREAQGMLDEILAMEELHDEEVRPLQVVVSEFFIRAFQDAEEARRAVMMQSAEAISIIQGLVESTTLVRALYAPDAAVACPDAFEDDMGSQQLADRYPDHFTTANAADLRRSRLRRAIAQGKPPVATRGDRLIDLIREGHDEE